VDRETWAEWLTQTAHTLHRAMLSHREGGRIVAGATFRSKAMLNLKITSTRVLHDAGFDLLHASMASETVIDYVWGYVIEEQAAPAPTELESVFSPEEGSDPRSEEFPEWKMLEEVMDERKQLTRDELFDWGLQIIINGLKLSLDGSRSPAKP
jgi:TetR/AcrR family transcriptional regulator, tetracycline repressor protein